MIETLFVLLPAVVAGVLVGWIISTIHRILFQKSEDGEL